MVLSKPQMQGDDLIFAIELLEGDLTGAEGPAAVLIDIIGRPLTPLSYAGVARRRTAHWGAWYAGAAAATDAYARPACGYTPYPPC